MADRAVREDERTPTAPAEGVSEHVLVPRLEGSPLSLSVVRLARGSALPLGDAGADLLLYGFAGTGSLELDGDASTLDAGYAGLVCAGDEATLRAGSEALAAVCARVAPETDRHAPLGSRAPIVGPDAAGRDRATGARSFRILFGPHNGSTRATLFLGFIPPGRAPWHYHLYDEIVWVPEGPGRLHVGESVEELGAGSGFRLRPREVHIVENTSTDRELTVLGVFTPAGSPSAAYLTADVAAAYSFAE